MNEHTTTLEELKKAAGTYIKRIRDEKFQERVLQTSQQLVIQSAKALTEAWFTMPEDGPHPEFIVIEFNGSWYMIKFDTEGGSYHEVTPVDMVLTMGGNDGR